MTARRVVALGGRNIGALDDGTFTTSLSAWFQTSNVSVDAAAAAGNGW